MNAVKTIVDAVTVVPRINDKYLFQLTSYIRNEKPAKKIIKKITDLLFLFNIEKYNNE